jgi:hypothetical protein
MNSKRISDAAATHRFLVIMTLVLPPLLWGLGFLGSSLMGCEPSLARPKATAYALSGTAGWAVYLLIGQLGSPSILRPGYLPAVMPGFAMVNIPMLNPTRTPWPFPDMLAHGLVVAAAFAIFMALVSGLLLRVMKGIRPTSPVPEPVSPGSK